MCLDVLRACMYVCHLYACKKREPDPLELELLMVVNWYVGIGNLTWVFRPEFFFFFFKDVIFISFYVDECVSVWMHPVWVQILRRLESDPFEQVKTVVSHLMGVLGTELE